MLIRTHLAQDASWSEALLGAPRRPVEESTAPASSTPPQQRVAPAGSTAGENPADNRAAEAGTRATGNRLDTASEQDLAVIRKLKARDREVRAHEQAHASVGGQYAGAATFTYQRGPDGVLYAVGGEVSIDISAVPGAPQATLDKALQVQRAALAPRDPSSTDRRVAMRAQALARDARAQLAELAALERETAPSAQQEVESTTRRIDTTA